MKPKVFREILHKDLEKLVGFTVAEVLTETNASGDGFCIRFEREIHGGVIAIDVNYDNEDETGVEYMISEEYIK